MDIGIASHQARSYTVATAVYEGPLDLLLQLIESQFPFHTRPAHHPARVVVLETHGDCSGGIRVGVDRGLDELVTVIVAVARDLPGGGSGD